MSFNFRTEKKVKIGYVPQKRREGRHHSAVLEGTGFNLKIGMKRSPPQKDQKIS